MMAGEGDKKKVEWKLWKKVLTFTRIYSQCIVSIGVFFLFHPFLHPYIELLGSEMCKNCSMQGNSLSCQTSEGRNRENEREKVSEIHGGNAVRVKEKRRKGNDRHEKLHSPKRMLLLINILIHLLVWVELCLVFNNQILVWKHTKENPTLNTNKC